MNRRRKLWCMERVILPASLLVLGNNTTDPRPECHAPPHDPEITVLQPILSWLEDHWVALLLVTAATIASLGIYLAVQRRRWRRALDDQLEHGVLTEEEHRRLS